MYRILVIDDEPWSREVVKSLGQWDRLQMSVVGEAEDGNQGMGLMEELRPHIVITDMRMPGLEGVELLKAINERFPQLKIIVMSGYDDFVYLKQAIRSRAIEYLLKPIDPDELNSSLEQCARELDRDREKWGTPPIFDDAAVLEKYLALRQLVYGHLLELSKPGVMQAFESMRIFMESALQEAQSTNILPRIGHDFIIMLEEFMSENDMPFNRLWNEKNSEWVVASGWNTVTQVMEDMGWLYEKAIDALELIRKNKNRIDLSEVQAYMDRHFQNAISLETIAQRFFVSKEHLSRAFKAFAGENVSDYIQRKRMEKAKELIVEQKLAIKRVAELMGYEDIAYFYRVFKKHFGLTPGELRKDD